MDLSIVTKYFGFNDAVDELMNHLIDEMKSAGAVMVDPADLESHGKFDDTELLVLMYELKADLNAYLSSRPNVQVHSLTDVIAFNEKNKQKEMPYFGQDLFLKAQEKGPLTDKDYITAVAANRSLSREHGIDGLMDKFHLDAIVGLRIDVVEADGLRFAGRRIECHRAGDERQAEMPLPGRTRSHMNPSCGPLIHKHSIHR